jgi:uncharacterized protein
MAYWNSFELKQDLDHSTGIITGYGSVFKVLDETGDIVQKGAYLQTIAEAKAAVQKGEQKFLWPMLWQHDVNFPIGGWIDAVEDAYGLKCTGQILLTLSKGIEVWTLLKEQAIRSLSIGYDVASNGCYYEKGARNLTNLNLWEISVVTFPACTQATVSSVKSPRELRSVFA